MASSSKSPTKPHTDGISRRGLSRSENVATPITPPARYISSNYSTPGSTYGKEEDAIVLELSPRYIKAGIEGESHPQCKFDFRPGGARRVGDYRQYLPKYTRPKEALDWEKWGDGYELWRNDLRGVDLGLLSDKLERAVRDIFNKHLLADAGSARIMLVVPSLVPHPVLETVLTTMFERWPFPSISLLPTPATALVAAGLRSGVVIDIGWEETVATAVYEYREVRVHRSTRAMKSITREFGTWAKEILPTDCRVDLEAVEDCLSRLAAYACRQPGDEWTEQSAQDNAGDDEAEGLQNKQDRTSEKNGAGVVQEVEKVELGWPTDDFTKTVSFSVTDIREKLSTSLLGKDGEQYPDDEETPLHRLLYKTFLLLPADTRGICLSRIVFIGAGAENTNFPSVILNAFSKLLVSRGWTAADGQPTHLRRQAQSELAHTRTEPPDARHDDIIFSDKAISEERHLREKHKQTPLPVHGVVRRIDTLGSWPGVSLLASLKVKSFVEIQRERFLSHGLAGASRELEQSVLPQHRMNTLGTRPKAGERTSWTLAGWG